MDGAWKPVSGRPQGEERHKAQRRALRTALRSMRRSGCQRSACPKRWAPNFPFFHKPALATATPPTSRHCLMKMAQMRRPPSSLNAPARSKLASATRCLSVFFTTKTWRTPLWNKLTAWASRHWSMPMHRFRCKASRRGPNGKEHITHFHWLRHGSITC